MVLVDLNDFGYNWVHFGHHRFGYQIYGANSGRFSVNLGSFWLVKSILEKN